MFNKIRKWLIKKLLRDEDGYTFTGFSEGEVLKFYYQEDTKKYLIGMRSDNWYYFEPTLSGWSSYASRYLPWGQTVEHCVFNTETKEMESYTYNKEPKEIDFRKWMYGIFDNIHEQYIDCLMSETPESLIETQAAIRSWNDKYKEN